MADDESTEAAPPGGDETPAQVRASLLARCQSEHDRLVDLISSLTPHELELPVLIGGWSVKDHAAHITWWERRLLALLGQGQDPQADFLEPVTVGQDDEPAAWTEAINMAILATYREDDVATVREAFDRTFDETMRVVQSCTDDVLTERFEDISANTDWHYSEHADIIMGWQRARGLELPAAVDLGARSRARLLSRSRTEHARLETFLAGLTDEQMQEIGVTPDWSVKDHLAHLSWWEQRVITVLRGDPDPMLEAPGGPDDDNDAYTDRVNAWVREQNRDRGLDEVRAAFQASYRDMLRLIVSIPDDVLAERFEWISGNSEGHYVEHADMIAGWLENDNNQKLDDGKLAAEAAAE